MATLKNNQSVKSVKRGLHLLRAGWFFNNFMLVLPVIVLVYTQRGISVGDFFLIQGIFRLVAFLFEIPSGYLSDRFSRRRVMIMGGAFSMAGFSVIAMAYGFWAIVLGEALLGVASALFTGTLEAYTYDLLKRNKTQKQFLKEFGNIMTFGSAASFVAAIFGGILFARFGGDCLLWVQILFALMSVFAFCFLPELLEVKRVVKNKTAIADALGITWHTLQNPRLRNLILFPAMFGAFTIVLLWISQPIMETAMVPVQLFGLYLGMKQFSEIVLSKYAYKICERYGEIKISIITIGAVVLSIFMGLVAIYAPSMTLVYVVCSVLAMLPAVRVLNNLQYNTLIHHSIKSQERGTVLSTRAMVSTVCGAMTLMLAKVLLDGFGITATLVVFLCMTVLLVWALKKVSEFLVTRK
ncbi:MAG: MFS transporter [Alphaproteobacteria bacterium]|nr:MFS transporter [Alphaproteobacteria bacterium]